MSRNPGSDRQAYRRIRCRRHHRWAGRHRCVARFGLGLGINVAHADGLIAVLPMLAGITGEAYLHPAALSHGFHTAVLLAAGACAVDGLLAAATIARSRTAHPHDREWHCALDAPPLRGQHHAAIS